MNLKTLAKKAGYRVTLRIVPKKYYTITNLETGLKSNLGMNKAFLVKMLVCECKKKGYILQIKG